MHMELNKFLQSKIFKRIIWVIIVIIVSLFVFGLGIFVGYQKASFSRHWGERYRRNFNGREFLGAHGAFGQIIKIEGATLVIRGSDDLEKTIVITGNTIIKHFRDRMSSADLKIDDYVTIIGNPDDDGQIEANLIRVMYW